MCAKILTNGVKNVSIAIYIYIYVIIYIYIYIYIRSTAKSREKSYVFKHLFSEQLGFSCFYQGPGGFRKLREACRKNFHLVAPPKTSVVTIYDQKTKKVNDYKSNDYFNVSVHPTARKYIKKKLGLLVITRDHGSFGGCH